MKLIITLFLFFINFQIIKSQIIKNDCNKNILNSKELEKCINDSIYIGDFEPRINYISKLTTGILPKYRKQRNILEVEKSFKTELDHLKKIYDSVSTKKIDTFLKDSYKNGQYVSPKGYLSTMIAMQSFNLYPDTYAMLVNRTHIILNPETSEKNLKLYANLIDKIFNKIPNNKKIEIIKIVTKLREEKKNIQINRFIELFQDDEMLTNERNKYDVIDYLLWTT